VSNQYNDILVSQMGEPLSVEENAELYPRVADGDAAAREAMIVGNMALVIAKVEGFIRCFPRVAYLRDDLASAGFAGLVKAVNNIAAGEGPRKAAVESPTDYLGMWISRELGRLVEDESPIRLPHESSRQAKLKGESLSVPATVNFLPERFEAASYERELELRDLVHSCCSCEEEHAFVRMREAGHTYAETAQAINMPVTSAYVMGQQLSAKVQRRFRALL